MTLTIEVVVDEEVIDFSKETATKAEDLIGEVEETKKKIEQDLNVEPKGDNSSENPQITLRYSTPQDTWTNQDVTVTASVDLPGYEIQMCKDGETWEDVSTLTYTLNGDVYARTIQNGVQKGETVKEKVKNIDKTPPNVGQFFDGEMYLTYEEAYEHEEVEGLYCYDYYYIDGVTLELQDGTDFESGHKSTTYSVYHEDPTLTNNLFEYDNYECDINNIPSNWRLFIGSDDYYLELINNLTAYNGIKQKNNGYKDLVMPCATAGPWSGGAWHYYVKIKTIDNVGNEATAVCVFEIEWFD